MCPLHVRSAKHVCKKRTRFAERTFAKCPLSEKCPPDVDFYSRKRKNEMSAQRNVCSKKEHVSLSGHSENVRTAKLTIPCRRKGYHFRDVQKTKNYVKPNTKAQTILEIIDGEEDNQENAALGDDEGDDS